MQEMLKPSDFGLKDDNIFIIKNIFETKFGTPIIFFKYANLKQTMVKNSNLQMVYKKILTQLRAE